MKEVERFYSLKLKKVKDALRNNGMVAYVVSNRHQALRKALGLIPRGASVGLGGSRTVVEIGLLDALRKGDYKLYDQYAPSLSHQEAMEIRKEGARAEYLVSGTNAVTEDGKLVNIDGIGNRVAGFCFGPEKVIIIVGRNKIVPDLDAAIYRAKNIAAPINAMRFGLKTPCVTTGRCSDCASPERICSFTLIIDRQKVRNRIIVILVNEDLGF